MKKIVMMTATLWIILVPACLHASIVVTGTPADSWAYALELNAGKGGSISWFAQQRPDFQDVVFQDYVTYSHWPTANWHLTNGQPDSLHVFSTYVLSTQDRTLGVRLVGDDGHSLFLDEAFVSGAGFGTKVDFNLALTAFVPRKIEVVGYNAGGPWLFAFGLPGNPEISGPIDEVEGVYLNADGNFSAVPEPSMVITFCGLLGIGFIFNCVCSKVGQPLTAGRS